MIKKLIAGSFVALLSVACFAEPAEETQVDQPIQEDIDTSSQAVTLPCGTAWSCSSIAPAGYTMTSTKYCPDTDGFGGTITCWYQKGQTPGYVIRTARSADNCDVCRDIWNNAASCSTPNHYTTWTCSAN